MFESHKKTRNKKWNIKLKILFKRGTTTKWLKVFDILSHKDMKFIIYLCFCFILIKMATVKNVKYFWNIDKEFWKENLFGAVVIQTSTASVEINVEVLTNLKRIYHIMLLSYTYIHTQKSPYFHLDIVVHLCSLLLFSQYPCWGSDLDIQQLMREEWICDVLKQQNLTQLLGKMEIQNSKVNI